MTKKKSAKWFPTIDKSKCKKCLACVKFCKNGVYKEKKGAPKVVNPQNCVVGCRGCEKICPAGAISHPSDDVLEEIAKEKSDTSF